jgi:lipopolysaccharide transport system permease protein
VKIRHGFFADLIILWRFRERLTDGIIQDVRQRYAGSLLGSTWVVLYPTALLAIYAVVYVAVLRVRPPTMDEYSYVVLVFSGLVPLLSFNEALIGSTGALVANRSLLLNTVFPAELIPVRAALAAQVPSLCGLAITLAAALAVGRGSWVTPLGVALLWTLLVVFATGLGWILALVTLVLRDIQQSLGLVLMALLVLSPVAYTPEMVPRSLKLLIYLNPLSYFVLGFQTVICHGQWPEPIILLATLGLALGAFSLGFWFFRRAKFIFFDYA